jgi:hypothetical protein
MSAKLTTTDPNYCCTVVRLSNLTKLDGLDNLIAFPIYGFQALIGKSHQNGELGLLFTAECQLSEDFCFHNNLYDKPELNHSKDAKGYLSHKRRIRAIRLRGYDSSALFMPISSLNYLDMDGYLPKEGDTFNEINGTQICKKYFIQNARKSTNGKVRNKRKTELNKKKLNVLLFPEHIDTSHWARSSHLYDDDQEIIVTWKGHGSSVRLTHQQVSFFPKWVQKFPYWFAKYFRKSRWETIAGSRRVVKLLDNEQSTYYNVDIYNQALTKVTHIIPKSWIIFGELIGWAGDKEIQKNYSYNVPQGEHRLYVYRIAIINDDGFMVDLHWDQVVQFCKNNGLLYCPELWRGKKKDFIIDNFLDIKFFEAGYMDCPKLSKEAPCDEGVVIRVEGKLYPQYFKAKSPIFLGHETKMLDLDVISIEDIESQTQEGEI